MLTEQKLIAELRRGDMKAYEQAFHTYYPKFVRFANYIVGDLPVAKDLVQNVFLKVWRYRDRLDSSLSLNNYFFVLTKREVLNYLRTKRVFETLDASLDIQGGGLLPDSMADASKVREHVYKLPEQRRNVFILSRFYGIPNKDIAKKLSISEKTVERHITLAGKQLRDELEGL
ncbi:MAG: RNA polymerase sigma-70 factor [Bacteroidales bacterium]|nr:RNA polymerase sigma-70 factor [Bacteroidales bacterium]